MADKFQEMQLSIARGVSVDITFEGVVTQGAIGKLVELLNLQKDTFPVGESSGSVPRGGSYDIELTVEPQVIREPDGISAGKDLEDFRFPDRSGNNPVVR